MKAIVFLHYRAGSTLFEALCGKPWRILGAQGQTQEAIKCYNNWRASEQPFYLPTKPPIFTEDITVPVFDVPYKNFVYMTHIGDWWGQLPSRDIGGPYDYLTPMKWGCEDLRDLGPEWKFVSLMRDGRNQLESLKNMKGGIEELRMTEDAEDYFKVLAKGFRNRARIALDCQQYMPNQYRIFKFEDLITRPIHTVQKMFDFLGLVADTGKIAGYWEQIRSGQKHSSFDDNRFNKRWHVWTPAEMELFNKIAGLELQELGYE